MRLLARVGLAFAPALLAAAGAGVPVLVGCSGDGGGTPAPPVPSALPGDDACAAALGTSDEAKACAGSPIQAVAAAQLQFTTAYLAGRDQCAGTDVSTADGCYATSQCTLLQALRDTEGAILPAIPDDRYTGSVCQ